jgi:hypothetical protein
MDAKKVQAEYDRRLAWVMKFREVVPTLLAIGEELNAPAPRDVALGGMWWTCAPVEVRGSDGTLLSISRVEARVSIQWGGEGALLDGIVFSVGRSTSGIRSHFDEVMTDPSQLKDVARRFFTVLNEASKPQKAQTWVGSANSRSIARAIKG